MQFSTYHSPHARGQDISQWLGIKQTDTGPRIESAPHMHGKNKVIVIFSNTEKVMILGL